MLRQARDELLSHHPGRAQYTDFNRVHALIPVGLLALAFGLLA